MYAPPTTDRRLNTTMDRSLFGKFKDINLLICNLDRSHRFIHWQLNGQRHSALRWSREEWIPPLLLVVLLWCRSRRRSLSFFAACVIIWINVGIRQHLFTFYFNKMPCMGSWISNWEGGFVSKAQFEMLFLMDRNPLVQVHICYLCQLSFKRHRPATDASLPSRPLARDENCNLWTYHQCWNICAKCFIPDCVDKEHGGHIVCLYLFSSNSSIW